MDRSIPPSGNPGRREGLWRTVFDGPCPLSLRTIRMVFASDHYAPPRLAAICARIH